MRLIHKVLTGAVAVAVVAGLVTVGSAGAHTVGAKAGAQAKASTIPLRVMPLGDSVTLGTGSPTRSSYRAALALRLEARRHGDQLCRVAE